MTRLSDDKESIRRLVAHREIEPLLGLEVEHGQVPPRETAGDLDAEVAGARPDLKDAVLGSELEPVGERGRREDEPPDRQREHPRELRRIDARSCQAPKRREVIFEPHRGSIRREPCRCQRLRWPEPGAGPCSTLPHQQEATLAGGVSRTSCPRAFRSRRGRRTSPLSRRKRHRFSELGRRRWTTWGGTFEQLQSATQRLQVVVPLALLMVLVLLFAMFGNLKDGLLVLLIYQTVELVVHKMVTVAAEAAAGVVPLAVEEEIKVMIIVDLLLKVVMVEEVDIIVHMLH